MAPPSPTATSSAPFPARLLRNALVPGERFVHATPSAEVRIVPSSPAATNWLPCQATLASVLVVFEIRMSQSLPSAEVRMVPFSPTATNWPTCHVTPCSVLPCGDGLAQFQFVCACASALAVHRRNATNDLTSFIVLLDNGVSDCVSTRSWNEVPQCDAPFAHVQRIGDQIPALRAGRHA